MNFLRSTSTWAMLFCLLAAVSPALPWKYQSYGVPPTPRAVIDLITFAQGGAARSTDWSSAYTDWHGAVISIVGVLGCLFVLATGPLKPTPWWRTLGVATIAIGVLVVYFFAMHRTTGFPLHEYGALLSLIAVTGLMLIVALEIRSLIQRHTPR